MPTRPRTQRTEIVEHLNGGKLRLERRNGSANLYASAYLQGRNVIKSTGEETPGAARKVALNWYLEQLERIRRGDHLRGKTFSECAEAFLQHAESMKEVTEGQRRNYRQKWSLLERYFGDVLISNVDAAFLVRLRDLRKTNPVVCLDEQGSPRPSHGKTPSNATLKKDMNFVSLVCRHAKEWMKCLDALPEFPSFRGRLWKIKANRRPFLDVEQWRRVRQRAKDRMNEEGLNPRTRRQRQELYAFLLISVGAALRVDEAYSLRWMDCDEIVLADEHRTEAVRMRVFGKHATVEDERELAYALYEGVTGYRLLKASRPDAKPSDHLFLESHRDGVRELLEDAGVREKEGATRDAKSLRQTGISLRLEQGPSPDYRDIAKWARTSVTQIARFYDQAHPEESVRRITGFRTIPKPTPRNAKEARRLRQSAATLTRLAKLAKAEVKLHPWET